MHKNDIPLNAASQVQHPWNATIRTTIQTGISTILVAIVALETVAELAPQVLEAIQELLPANIQLILTGFIAAVTAVSAAITRVMAIPAVNEWLKKFKLGAPDR